MAAVYLKTFDDILDACAEELKLQSSDLTNRARLKRLVNEAYLDIVVPDAQWSWLRGNVSLLLDSAFATGTASTTNGDTSVTLTTGPGLARERHYFSIVGEPEVYRIASHTAASTTIVLDKPYLGTTDTEKSFKIWTDALALPVDARETFEVTHNHMDVPLDGVGLQEFRRNVVTNPKAEGRPAIYSTSDFVEPSPYAAISGLPSLSTRASSGFLKTLVFATTVADYLEAGDRIRITGATDSTYNGEFVVASVSTTTVQYVGTTALSESAIADLSLTVTLLGNAGAVERYRELLVYPSLNTLKTILNVDYIKDVRPLEDDDDEPLMPLTDRAILKYGALMFAWSSIMKDEAQQQRNERQFYSKLAKMKGNLGDSTDKPRLSPSKTYLARKRRRPTGQSMSGFRSFGSNGGGATVQPTEIINTANSVAVFGADGVLDASATISTTELSYLDNATSNIQTQLDDITTLASGKILVGNGSNVATEVTPSGDATISTAGVIGISAGVIVDADIDAAAAITRSKIAVGTADHVLINDGAGALSSEAQLAVTRGGTGLATFGAAGAIPYSTAATTLAALAPGLGYQYLRMNSGATAPAWGSDTAAIAASVAASALTVSLKGFDGNNASATNPIDITFRNATLTSGTPSIVSVTGALSVVVSSGSTLGHASAVAHDIYVYAINNAGTVELAVSSHGFWNEGALQSTTAEGGAGAADSSALLYSTTARASVPVRLLGKLVSTQATAGTWATAPSAIQGLPIAVTQVVARANLTTAQTGITNKVIPFNVINKDTLNGFSSGTYTVKAPGDYFVTGAAALANLDGATDAKVSIRKNGTIVAEGFMSRHASNPAGNASGRPTDILCDLVAGDTIDLFVAGDASFDIDNNGSRTWCAIHRIGS